MVNVHLHEGGSMSLNHVSADIPAITAFGTAVGAAGAGLAGEKSLLEVASSGVNLPALGVIATEFAVAYETAHAVHSAGFAKIVGDLEDSAARAAATSAAYLSTEGIHTATIAKEGVEC